LQIGNQGKQKQILVLDRNITSDHLHHEVENRGKVRLGPDIGSDEKHDDVIAILAGTA
jgi:hypothetical protein